jgi:peptidoglycan/LPS O-acetylase OafA/YrhL
MNHDTADYFSDGAAPDNPEAHKLEAYPMLDWLRFVLASTVLLTHEGIKYGPINGGLAVAVFLALSGWLIGGILLKSDRSDLPRFFYNRATRIWAPYFAAIVLLYTAAALREGVDGNWFKYLFYDVTFTHYNFTVFPRASLEMPLDGTGNMFWSLAVEEQFYLAAPLLMLFTRWGKSIVAWVVIAVALIALQSIYAPIAAGVLAANLNRRHAIVATRSQRLLAVAGALAALAAIFWRDVEPFRSIFSICVVLALTAPGARGRLGVFFGGISFPLYLNQWVGGFTINAISRYVVPIPAEAVLTLIFFTSVAVSVVAWFLIDRPVMLYRNRWYTPARGRALGITAYLLVGTGLIGGLLLKSLGY